jgi:hypothetical protein
MEGLRKAGGVPGASREQPGDRGVADGGQLGGGGGEDRGDIVHLGRRKSAQLRRIGKQASAMRGRNVQ